MTDRQIDLFDIGEPDDEPAQSDGKADDVDSSRFSDIRVGRFPFDRRIADHLLQSGISRGRLRLAAELVAMEPQQGERSKRALFMAVIIGLEAQGQGSTFVPLPAKDDYFQRRLKALLPDDATDIGDQWRAGELLAAIENLLDESLRLIGSPGEFKPLIVDSDRLYHQRVLLHETRLVDAVATRLQRPDVDLDDQKLTQALDDVRRHQPPGGGGKPIRLNPEQQYALLTALHRPMTLITGGPGTGKTSIIVSILRMLVRLGIAPGAIALAAPTGKAANRMAESIYDQLDRLQEPPAIDRRLAEHLETPKTLHRLLGYSPHRDDFRHHPGNPLAQRVIIVDESSMIDLFLMERLLGATSPNARLILLGDADQLPSVDTGAVLRDLIPELVCTDTAWRDLVDGDLPSRHGDAPTADSAVRLQRSYRMRPEDPAGRQILRFAQAIRDFETEHHLPDLDVVEQPEPDMEFPDGVHLWAGTGDDDSDGLDSFVDWWFDRVVLGGERSRWKRRFNHAHRLDADDQPTDEAARRIRQLLDHYRRARILTLTRVFDTGSDRINHRLHRATAGLGSKRSEYGYDFHPGEPVMMTRNDYRRDLFNGDQGVVVWCEQTDDAGSQSLSLMAVFERTDKLVVVPVRQLGDDLEHAFAMTVHKSQGSEFNRVAIVLPAEPMALLNRELLYTGMTRARRGVLVVGRQKLLTVGASTHSERFSAVDTRLADRLADQ